MTLRVLVVTSETARPIIEELVSRSSAVREGRVEARVLALPVPVIGVLSARAVAALLSRMKRDLEWADLVLVPGTVSGDLREAAERLGVALLKASRDAGLLPEILDYVAEGGELSTEAPAEEYLSGPTGAGDYTVAFTVKGLRVPLRGPPMILAAEVPPGAGDPEGLAERYVEEGASLLVVGHWGPPEYDEHALAALRAARRVYDGPVFAEAPTPRAAEALVSAGADGIITSPSAAVRAAERLGDEAVYVVGDRRVGEIAEAVEALRGRGLRVVADPVVGVPLVDFSATVGRYLEASRLGTPLWFSAANVATSLYADTHSVYTVLASLAAELGASFFLVVEDGYHTVHAAAEARRAIALVERAWSLRRPPAGPGIRGVFALKQPEPPPPPLLSAEGAVMVEEPVEPVMEDSYFVVSVDHARGLIVVEYRTPRDPPRRWAGRRAMDLARVVLREARVSPEHAAYLGKELYKAELALRLGKTYLQDSEVVEPPW